MEIQAQKFQKTESELKKEILDLQKSKSKQSRGRDKDVSESDEERLSKPTRRHASKGKDRQIRRLPRTDSDEDEDCSRTGRSGGRDERDHERGRDERDREHGRDERGHARDRHEEDRGRERGRDERGRERGRDEEYRRREHGRDERGRERGCDEEYRGRERGRDERGWDDRSREEDRGNCRQGDRGRKDFDDRHHGYPDGDFGDLQHFCKEKKENVHDGRGYVVNQFFQAPQHLMAQQPQQLMAQHQQFMAQQQQFMVPQPQQQQQPFRVGGACIFPTTFKIFFCSNVIINAMQQQHACPILISNNLQGT